MESGLAVSGLSAMYRELIYFSIGPSDLNSRFSFGIDFYFQRHDAIEILFEPFQVCVHLVVLWQVVYDISFTL